jgi:hypothetical protein
MRVFGKVVMFHNAMCTARVMVSKRYQNYNDSWLRLKMVNGGSMRTCVLTRGNHLHHLQHLLGSFWTGLQSSIGNFGNRAARVGHDFFASGTASPVMKQIAMNGLFELEKMEWKRVEVGLIAEQLVMLEGWEGTGLSVMVMWILI